MSIDDDIEDVPECNGVDADGLVGEGKIDGCERGLGCTITESQMALSAVQ